MGIHKSFENRIKEKLSSHFVGIIAHLGRLKIKTFEDDDGIDFEISRLEELVIGDETSLYDIEGSLYVQLKSTTEKQITIRGDYLEYKLRVSNFNKLIHARKTNKFTASILALFILPEEQTDWVNLTDDELYLRKHCFWYYPENNIGYSSKGKNLKEKILVPIKNRFSLDSFDYFFDTLMPK